MKSQNVNIYYIQADEEKVTHYGEYAGAGQEVRRLAGTRTQMRWDGYWFFCGVPAVNIRSWFQNRIGASLGSNNLNEEPFECTSGVQMDRYNLAKAVRRGEVELGEEWMVATYGTLYADGSPICFVERRDLAGKLAEGWREME